MPLAVGRTTWPREKPAGREVAAIKLTGKPVNRKAEASLRTPEATRAQFPSAALSFLLKTAVLRPSCLAATAAFSPERA